MKRKLCQLQSQSIVAVDHRGITALAPFCAFAGTEKQLS
jgi:hypothetical protein